MLEPNGRPVASAPFPVEKLLILKCTYNRMFKHINLFKLSYRFCIKQVPRNSVSNCLISTVKSRLSERRLSETTGLFEDDGQSQLFSRISIAIKLPIIRISVIRKIRFFEVFRRSRLKKLLLNYPSRFEVEMSPMMIMISLLSRVQFTHPSDFANKVATGN